MGTADWKLGFGKSSYGKRGWTVVFTCRCYFQSLAGWMPTLEDDRLIVTDCVDSVDTAPKSEYAELGSTALFLG
jgi:hypothetical protein